MVAVKGAVKQTRVLKHLGIPDYWFDVLQTLSVGWNTGILDIQAPMEVRYECLNVPWFP